MTLGQAIRRLNAEPFAWALVALTLGTLGTLIVVFMISMNW